MALAQEVCGQQRFVEERLQDNVHVACLPEIKKASNSFLCALSPVDIGAKSRNVVQFTLFCGYFWRCRVLVCQYLHSIRNSSMKLTFGCRKRRLDHISFQIIVIDEIVTVLAKDSPVT